ncbi:MAG: GNAT family N-acetyltransferase [Pseudomonadota bacterium]
MGTFEIPTLESERLVLRAWQLADLDRHAAFAGDQVLARYRGGAVNRSKAKSAMATQNGDWSLHGYGGFAVALRDEPDHAIGMTGLYHPPEFDEPELFYSLYRDHHGHGYAVEMGRAVQVWAAGTRGLPPLMSMIHPDNAPSRSVSERLGGAIEAEVTWRGEPRLRYRHVHPTR